MPEPAKREAEPQPLDEVRRVVERIINESTEEETLGVHGRKIPINDVVPEIRYFHEQSDFLRSARIPTPIVIMRDHDPIEGRPRAVPVLLKLLKPFELSPPILQTDALRARGFAVDNVMDAKAKQIFADRLFDFVLTRLMGEHGDILTDTIVETNRDGDTILYALGLFFSTGTACGTSLRARVKLLPGRYSFGIVNAGVPDFEDVLWTIPTADGLVRVRKPTAVGGAGT